MLFHGIEHTELAIGNGEMVLLRIDVGGNLAGTAVKNLGESARATVIAVDRMGKPLIPGPDTTFQEGDVAHIIVIRDAIETLRKKIDG